ncbi:MAG: glycosyltransferase [Candidatus Levybacteria bacterium]|nr:glycosyltransferase [Candidatus Levybacteria bacterium]
MKTTVVIPTLNEEKYIGGILENLENQTKKADEIIVVDAYSADRTLKIVKKYKNVKILQAPPSIAGQRNLGAKHANNELIIFIDADTEIAHDFLQKALGEFERKNLDIACPFYLARTKHPLLIASMYLYNFGFSLYQRFLPSGAGCCIIIRKTVFEKGGGFDTSIKFEDIEFIRRVGRKNKSAMLHLSIYVSPRRFYEDGVVRTTLKYLFMSIFFTFGIFRSANFISYKMGHHK